MSRGRRKPPLRPDHGCSARNSRDSDYNLASPGRGESKMAAGGRVVLLAVGWLRGWLTGWSTSSGRSMRVGGGQGIVVVQEVEEEEVEVAVGKGDAVVAEGRGSGDRC